MANRINIKQELKRIASAIFGREVRGSIHDGIEKVADAMNEVGNEWDKKIEDGDFQATIEVGEVATGLEGTKVEVTNSGTNHHAVLDFEIPEGKRGIDGVKGDSGVWSGEDEPPEEGDYDVWVNPEGSDDFEIKADSIVTDDGSTVQDKLDNSFSLGLDGNKNPQVQNSNGTILYYDDLNDLKYSGTYYTVTSATNKPVANNGYVHVLARLDDWVTQSFYDGRSTAKFERRLTDEGWSEWELVAGEVVLWTGSVNTGTLNLTQPLTRFRAVKILLTAQSAYAFGVVDKDNLNIRASCTDVANANGAINSYGIVLTYTSSTALVATIARSFLRSQSSATNITSNALTINKIVGLP